MTEKRFESAWEDYDGWGIKDTLGEYSDDEDYIDLLSGQKAVDVLNHFVYEIEHQKTELDQKVLRKIICYYNEWLLGHRRNLND